MRKSNQPEFLVRFSHFIRRNVRPLLLLCVMLPASIACSDGDPPIDPPPPLTIAELEARVFTLINQDRVDNGYAPLVLHEGIATQARGHSRNMADGSVPSLSHDGLREREAAIKMEIDLAVVSELVAMNSGFSDPAGTAVDHWIRTDEHRGIIEGDFNLTGIGVAENAGKYYVTQMFVKSR